MARAIHKLSDVSVKATKASGRHSDGGGLYLYVGPSGTKSWVFMWASGGKRREMGLGAYPSVTLAKARWKAAEYRQVVADGGDPISLRDRGEEPTFSEAVDQFLASMEKGWRNEKHRSQWRMTLTEYGKPLSSKKVSAIGTEDVLAVLKPIWTTKAETASRLRGRIERVLDFAKAKGWRQSENPALWRGHLKSILPARQKLQRGHHLAMAYPDVPAFVERLQAAEAMAARALEFLILCASRSGEVYGARWEELDMNQGIWTIPASRMKGGKVHRVPLSKRALAIVQTLHEAGQNDFVFPGEKPKKPLSSSAMEMLLRRMKVDVTVHGFRSSFRDWAGDATTFPREVAEAALAHKVGDETERAYRRSDALQKRRALMEAWSAHCNAPQDGEGTRQ